MFVKSMDSSESMRSKKPGTMSLQHDQIDIKLEKIFRNDLKYTLKQVITQKNAQSSKFLGISVYNNQLSMEFVWMFVPKAHIPNQNQVSTAPNNPPITFIFPEVPQEAPEPQRSPPPVLPYPNPDKLIITRADLEAAGNESRIKTWTQEEDRLLLKYRDKEGLDWQEVAKHIPNRTGRMCYNRHKRIVLSDKTPWRRKDDEKLLELMREHGEDWKGLSLLLKKWTPQQVRDHYNNHLRPGLRKEDWTIEEDVALLESINTYGKNWKEAMKVLPGRSLGQIQYRVSGRLDKLNSKKLEEMGQKRV